MTQKRASRTDWKRIDALIDDEIERMAEADTDNPATTEAEWLDAIIDLPPLDQPKTAVILGRRRRAREP
ncbi:hypothetical protein [Beijerinckia sp. L45]|uniref:hypothetical protein n=1 Tax=Beijerinckia sp. L45 TaxID=1641855 RepID=UPI00131BECB1|nr:hypothetical protein [Beijerinckia sp. L45]